MDDQDLHPGLLRRHIPHHAAREPIFGLGIIEEHALFGARGFEGVVAQVAQLETALGIHDLASFTPR
jgi:hypothetical protein